MFRSIQFVISACLLETHRPLFRTLSSKKKHLGETVCSSFLSPPFCTLGHERRPQTIRRYASNPKDTKYVSQKTFQKPFSCSSCSIDPEHTTDFLSVCKRNISVLYCSKTTTVEFIVGDCGPDTCLPSENHTDKRRCSVDTTRASVSSSWKSQKSFNDTSSTFFIKSYELSKGLWTSYRDQCSPLGPLKSQRCGLHRRVPQQAAFEDCLSAKNEDRCRVHLQPNAALYEKEKGKSRAAVLVSLCTVRGEPALLFTLRSSKLRGRHKGDVSFAGGKQDPSDRNVVETALREAREELGINVTENEVWGVLKPLNDAPCDDMTLKILSSISVAEFRFQSGMIIAPVLAHLGPLETLTLHPNPSEVEEIFTLTVSHLCDPQNRGYTHFRTGNRYGYTLPVFLSDKYRIWGLTAIALDLTLKLLVPE